MSLSLRPRRSAFVSKRYLQIRTLSALGQSSSLRCLRQGRRRGVRRCVHNREFTHSKNQLHSKTKCLSEIANDIRHKPENESHKCQIQACNQEACFQRLGSKELATAPAPLSPRMLDVLRATSNTTPTGPVSDQQSYPAPSCDEEKHLGSRVDPLAAFSANPPTTSCWSRLDDVEIAPKLHDLGLGLPLSANRQIATTADDVGALPQRSDGDMQSDQRYSSGLAKPRSVGIVPRTFYQTNLLVITTLGEALNAIWSDRLHILNPDSVFAGWAQGSLDDANFRRSFRGIMFYILLSPLARGFLLRRGTISLDKGAIQSMIGILRHPFLFTTLSGGWSQRFWRWRKAWSAVAQPGSFEPRDFSAVEYGIWRHAVDHYDKRLELPSERYHHWESWSRTYTLEAALEALIQEKSSSAVLFALQDCAHSDMSKRQNGVDRLKMAVLRPKSAATTRHVTRLMNNYHHWYLYQKRRLDPERLRRHPDKQDRNRLQLDIVLRDWNMGFNSGKAASEYDFLCRNGFATILRRDIPRIDSITERSSKRKCIDVLANLIVEVTRQLRRDIKEVISMRADLSSTLAPKPSVAVGTDVQPQEAKSVRKEASLSPAARDRLLSNLPSHLQSLIKQHVLTNEARFNTLIREQKPERWVCESLALLIQFELDKPREKRSSARNRTRRRKLMANATLIRNQLNGNNGKEVAVNGNDYHIKKQLKLVRRWRKHHLMRLQRLRQLSNPSVTSRRRMTQLEAVIREADKRLQMLQSKNSNNVSKPDGAGHHATLLHPDPLQDTFRDLEALIVLKPVSLPDRLYHQLSRDLLDSLNEACFVYGQSQDPSFMQEHHWNSPESIDLPVFLFTMMNHLELFDRFIAHQRVFSRLREFRNRYAHGAEITPVDEIIMFMHDINAVARLLRSSSVTTKVNDYRSLLIDFKANQTKLSKEACSIAQEAMRKLKAIAETEMQKCHVEAQKTPGEVQAGMIAAEEAIRKMTVRHAADIKETWQDTERSLALHAGQKLGQYAVEAQIRRLVDTVGPGASSVLFKIYKEQMQSNGDITQTVGVKDSLRSLERKLSHGLTSIRIENPAQDLPQADSMEEGNPTHFSVTMPLDDRQGFSAIDKNIHPENPTAPEHSKGRLHTLPEEQTLVMKQPRIEAGKRRRLLGEIAKNLRIMQSSLTKQHSASSGGKVDLMSLTDPSAPMISNTPAAMSSVTSPVLSQEPSSNASASLPVSAPQEGDQEVAVEVPQTVSLRQSSALRTVQLDKGSAQSKSSSASSPSPLRKTSQLATLGTGRFTENSRFEQFMRRVDGNSAYRPGFLLEKEFAHRHREFLRSQRELVTHGRSQGQPVGPAVVDPQSTTSDDGNNEAPSQSMSLFGRTRRPRAQMTAAARKAVRLHNQLKSTTVGHPILTAGATLLRPTGLSSPTTDEIGFGDQHSHQSLLAIAHRDQRKATAHPQASEIERQQTPTLSELHEHTKQEVFQPLQPSLQTIDDDKVRRIYREIPTVKRRERRRQALGKKAETNAGFASSS